MVAASAIKEEIRRRALELGACACGFACAAEVDAEAAAQYDRWVAAGACGTMDYCRRYGDVRRDPRLLLDGAETVISCAFNYYNPLPADMLPSWIWPRVARYAWGHDYHYVVKNALLQLGEYITAAYGGAVRACVDTAPIRERYWAQRAGIGFVGRNNQLIVPGVGSYVFLGELLWTGTVEPDTPCTLTCGDCGACVAACPGGALDQPGCCDARRCVSYLTIEHKEQGEAVGDYGDTPIETDMIYGCDACLKACPHNAVAKQTAIADFSPDRAILTLADEDLSTMTSSHFRRLTRHSAMSRVSLKRLQKHLLT